MESFHKLQLLIVRLAFLFLKSVVILNWSSYVLQADCLNNGLALTPPMGWSGWKNIRCATATESENCTSINAFKQLADYLIVHEYNDVGYNHIDVGIYWSKNELNLEVGDLGSVTNNKLFPEEISDLAEYLHQRDLKLGIYGNCSALSSHVQPNKTENLDSTTNILESNYSTIASTFSQWKLDAFIFDTTNLKPTQAESLYPRITKALAVTDGQILVNCVWPEYMIKYRSLAQLAPDFEYAQSNCHTWRYADDVQENWQSILKIVDQTIKTQNTIVKHHGPGHWFNPDQLIVGSSALTFDQMQAQMALWCIWGAPLYVKADLRAVNAEMADLLKNYYLIEVNQDKMGVLGLMVDQQDDGLIQAFVKPIEIIKNGCPSFGIVFLNRNNHSEGKLVSFTLRNLLKHSAISIAADRFKELYEGKFKPGGGFLAEECYKRLETGMSQSQVFNQTHSPEQKSTIALEEQVIEYGVFDLLEKRTLGIVALNDTLNLYVKPGGARAVRLIEINR